MATRFWLLASHSGASTPKIYLVPAHCETAPEWGWWERVSPEFCSLFPSVTPVKTLGPRTSTMLAGLPLQRGQSDAHTSFLPHLCPPNLSSRGIRLPWTTEKVPAQREDEQRDRSGSHLALRCADVEGDPSPSPSPSSASMLPVTSTHVLVNEDNSCLFNTEACRPLPCLQENHCITRSGPLKAPCKRQHHYSRCRLRHEHLGSEGATSENASRSQRYKCKRPTLRTPCLGLPPTPSHLCSPSSWMDFSQP